MAIKPNTWTANTIFFILFLFNCYFIIQSYPCFQRLKRQVDVKSRQPLFTIFDEGNLVNRAMKTAG
jgi:hypothetical protein